MYGALEVGNVVLRGIVWCFVEKLNHALEEGCVMQRMAVVSCSEGRLCCNLEKDCIMPWWRLYHVMMGGCMVLWKQVALYYRGKLCLLKRKTALCHGGRLC